MSQAVPPPIIRSTKLYIQRQVLSNQILLPAATVDEMELASSSVHPSCCRLAAGSNFGEHYHQIL